MPWTNADLKIFAAGLAIGGEWNGRIPGDEVFDLVIFNNAIIGEPFHYRGTSGSEFESSILYDCIMGEITEVE